MDNPKTNEEELTSTVGNLLSTSKDEKNDTCDSTPTSSTDAFTASSTSQQAADDTISSTSSDTLAEKMAEAGPSSTVNVMSSVKGRACSIVSEKDLIAMNITDTSTEKITENVDDIVQDLENLLGEPTTSLDFVIKPKEVKSAGDSIQKDFAQEIDEFSEMLQERCNETNIIPQPAPIAVQSVQDPQNDAEPPISSMELDKTDDAFVPDNSTLHEKVQTTEQEVELTNSCIVKLDPPELNAPDQELNTVSTSDKTGENVYSPELAEITSTHEKAEHSAEASISTMNVEAVSGEVSKGDTDLSPEVEVTNSQDVTESSQVSEIPVVLEEELKEDDADVSKENTVDQSAVVEELCQPHPESTLPEPTHEEIDVQQDQDTSNIVDEVDVPAELNEGGSVEKEMEVSSAEVVEHQTSSGDGAMECSVEENDEPLKQEPFAILESAEVVEHEKSSGEGFIERSAEESEESLKQETFPTSENENCTVSIQEQDTLMENVEAESTPEVMEVSKDNKEIENLLIPQGETSDSYQTSKVDDQEQVEAENVEIAPIIIAPSKVGTEDVEIAPIVAPSNLEESKANIPDTETSDVLQNVESKKQPNCSVLLEQESAPNVDDSVEPFEPVLEPMLEKHSVSEKDNEGDIRMESSVEPEPAPAEDQLREEDVITCQFPDVEIDREQREDSVVPLPEEALDDGNIETTPDRDLAQDLETLVQNTVDEISTILPPQESSSFVETCSSVLESAPPDIFPVSTMEDIPDLEVLNAISSLNDKADFIPELENDGTENDALLASSSLEQPSECDGPFKPCVQTILPTVDEIFTEQDDQQEQPVVDLEDDNLETLLAVATLQNDDFNMASVENFVPSDLNSVEPEVPEVIPPVEEPTTYEDDIREDVVEQTTQPQENKLKEPLSINIEDADKDRVYSPRLTIKPIKPCVEIAEGEVASPNAEVDEKESSKGSIKLTITKQSDNMHSILKIYDPDADSQSQDVSRCESPVPKLIIKSIMQQGEQPQSPKLTRSSKQVFSPSQRSSSPRITIKPIPKPEIEPVVPKIIIKPVLKPDECHRQKHSPKLTIKPIIKPDEEMSEPKVHSPRVTIKPIVKPPDEVEQVISPRITIKPVIKPDTVIESLPTTPRVTIKPVLKPYDKEKSAEIGEQVEKSSPKITIKPIVKPQEMECQDEYEESVKERLVLKIHKGTIPSSSKERKRDVVQEEEKSEKLAKIKLKFSKEGGHPHIVQTEPHMKRPSEQQDHDRSKRQKPDGDFLSGVTITPIPTHSKLKEMLCRSGGYSGDKVVTIDDDDDDVTFVEETNKPSPIVISEESNQDSINVATEARDPISDIPIFEITPETAKTMNLQPAPPVPEVPVPAPRKRGRPRKVPLQVREDFKDPKEEEPKPVVESTRPKRSCRGQSVRTTLGIKPRKPRGPGRGRGSKRGMGTRATPTPPEVAPTKPAKEPRLSAAKLRQQFKEDLLLLAEKSEPTAKSTEIDDGFRKSPLGPRQSENSCLDRADIVMYEEETRMSAETNSRAQTPAKQVVSSISNVDLVEESQSSIQSTATTESVKVRKGPRLEVHQEPEGAVISADQLAEYYWSGGGPYMLQEQVAQFLGIKSFKRKYPNIQRRVVDMQERDFIRESGLAGEAMCDLGLTAVNSTDILDIMYSDFQDKYEEYCKHQRDRQAKDLTNKQKALSLAASQEKTKMDITQQAVQSAASWNATFNKARRDQRKACMDLQTLTVHFPKGKMKQINKPKIGHYPVALVPGQFTDYYREFTPTEINNLPLNTLCYDPVVKGVAHEMECDSQTDGSGSESDTSSSDSDSSYSGSSDGEDCTLCKHSPKKMAIA